MTDVSIAAGIRPRRVSALRSAARPQIAMLAVQFLTGAGNLAFALVLVRVLTPAHYSEFAVFLAVALLVQTPSIALTAVAAIDAPRARALRRRLLWPSVGIGCAVAAASPVLASLLSLRLGLVVALGALVPSAALLGLDRGVLFGSEDRVGLAQSLIVEPIARIGVGIALAVAFGAMGAAAGVVIAGYVALAVTTLAVRRQDRDRDDLAPAAAAIAPAVSAAFVTFLLLAVMQTQDLIVANKRLGDLGAARFGVLSTLGGAAIFATATIPMVLLPAAARRREKSSAAALALTAIVGTVIACVGALAAPRYLELAFGREYGPVANLVGLYLAAMAFLGLARVLVARRCTSGHGRYAVGACGVGVIGHLVALLVVGGTARQLTFVSLSAMAGLALTLAVPDLVAVPAVRSAGPRARRWIVRPDVVLLAGLTGLAAVVRLAATRGLWVDEAISVSQAQMSFGAMWHDVASTDVHPPLHHVLLWTSIRLFGSSELAVRLPSLIAGVALVPMVFLTGRLVYDRRTAWVAAVLAAFAPFCVWYSQEARMYSLFMLFSVAAVYGQFRVLRFGRRRDWALYAVSTAALLWTQYFAVLPVLIAQLAFAHHGWTLRRDRTELWRFFRRWAAASLLIVVMVAPILPLGREQAAAYGDRTNVVTTAVPSQVGASASDLGGSVSVYAAGANLVWAIWGYHSDGLMTQMTALWPVAMLVALLLLGRGRSRGSTLLLAYAVGPMSALLLLATTKPDLFELRYFSGAVPVLLLLAARFVTATSRQTLALVTSAAVLSASMGIGLVDQQVNGANPRRYDFEGALHVVTANAQAGDIVLYEPVYLAQVVDYYAPTVESRALAAGVDDLPAGVTVWVVATTRVIDGDVSRARVLDAIGALAPDREVASTTERPNVEVWELR